MTGQPHSLLLLALLNLILGFDAGDESYHAACFTCKSCKNRIEELVFAKTSQGIYCMVCTFKVPCSLNVTLTRSLARGQSCHNERVAKSRKHAEKKRLEGKRERDKDKDRRRERDREKQLREVRRSRWSLRIVDHSLPIADAL